MIPNNDNNVKLFMFNVFLEVTGADEAGRGKGRSARRQRGGERQERVKSVEDFHL